MSFPVLKLLPAGVLAVLLAAVWCWGLVPAPTCPYVFEVELNSPVPATTRVSYERGAGWRESESAAQPVIRVGQFTPVRLPLVPGKYKALRFHPTDRPGVVIFRNARVTTFYGRTIRRFSYHDFVVDGANASTRQSETEIQLDPVDAAVAPSLLLTFDPPLRLALGFWSNVSLQAPRFFASVSVCFGMLLLVQLGWERRGKIVGTLRTLSQRHPQATLALCAALATLGSSYPVVFFGKSFVSPAPPLLYDSNPALPGFDDPDLHDTHGADTGAMMWQHFPITVRESRALGDGELPLWGRTNSSGVTLLGQGQSMLGDPLHLLVIATGGASWAFDLKFLIARALFACGISWCVWALTRDFAASAILALAGAFIGFFNFRFNHPAIFSVGYSPWILVAWLHLSLAPDRRALRRGLIVWFIANWMVITSGTVKEAYLLGIVLNVTGFLIFLLSRRPWSEKLRHGGVVALAGLAFVASTTPLWLTFLRSLSSSFTAYAAPTVQQIRQEWFIGLFDDLFYREYMPDHSVYQPSANFLILLGCVCAFQQAQRLWADRGLRVILIVSLVALSCAFQIGTTPWMAVWFLKIPFLRNVYHFGNIFSCIAIVHLAVLAGWGFAAARKPLVQGRVWLLVSTTVAVLAILFVPYFTMNPPSWAGPHVWHGWNNVTLHQAVVYANVFLLPVALGVLLWAASRRLRRGESGGGAMIGVGLALCVVLGRQGLHLPWPAAAEFITAPGKRADLTARSPAVQFLQSQVRPEPSRIIGTGSNFFPGFASVYNLEGINGPDALQNLHYRELAEAANAIVAPGDWRFELPPTDLPRWRPFLNFLNVRYVAAPVEALSNPEGYQRVARLDFDVFRSEEAWPRAFFCDRIESYKTVTELMQMIRQRSPGAPFVAMQNGDPIPNLPDNNSDRATSNVIAARNYSLMTNETGFTVDASGPGLAVLHEPWLKDDFRATLDGKPVPYFRVNHAFKAILLPGAGTYRVEFKYWPRDFGLMLMIGAAGLAFFIGLCIALPRGLEGPARRTIN